MKKIPPEAKKFIEDYLNGEAEFEPKRKKNIWGKAFKLLVLGAKAYLRYSEMRS